MRSDCPFADPACAGPDQPFACERCERDARELRTGEHVHDYQDCGPTDGRCERCSVHLGQYPQAFECRCGARVCSVCAAPQIAALAAERRCLTCWAAKVILKGRHHATCPHNNRGAV